MDRLTIGLDYGTDSARALIVNADSGEEISSAAREYDSWAKGDYCDQAENRFRQHPADYVTALEGAVKEAIAQAPVGTAGKIVGLAVDTTGSTPCPVDGNGVPLALHPEFKDNPDAMFILWKDHTANAEAEELSAMAKNWEGNDFTKYSGGSYSSEWFWAKILQVSRNSPKIAKTAASWCEHCDWMPALLTGVSNVQTIKRSRCAAGHKAMWHRSWGGLPPEGLFAKIDPRLKGVRAKLYTDTVTAEIPAGRISETWADHLGLPRSLVVGTGAIDAHFGAVGGQIEPYHLCKVMGTSSCDMMIVPPEALEGRVVKGICGQVDGSIVPDMIGLEAGQAAFGDIFAWFARLLSWGLEGTPTSERRRIERSLLPRLEAQAAKIPTDAASPLALDWFNGRRSPDANLDLSGAISGLRLGSDAPAIYKALVESALFGAKSIAERFASEGVPPRGVTAMGGVAKRSPFVMQTCADVLGLPVKIVKTEQSCALGAALFASVAAGVHKDIQTAMAKMGQGFEKVYVPRPRESEILKRKYSAYQKMGRLLAPTD